MQVACRSLSWRYLVYGFSGNADQISYSASNSRMLLQRVPIARNADRCKICLSVCLSVCPSVRHVPVFRPEKYIR